MPLCRSGSRGVALTVVALLCVACSKSSPPSSGPLGAARTAPGAVHVEGFTFRDGQGRQLVFRGYNVKIAPLYDVTFSDGRTANETLYDFDEDSATRYEQLGFNAMRLAVNWSGLEPSPGQYAPTFLAAIDTILGYAAEHRFYVLIDMHQDAYSKEIGDDGEPLWAIVPPPTELLSGPYTSDRLTSAQVVNAEVSFFANAPAADGRLLQTAYAQAVAQIVQHVLGNPWVIGYEAMNEPVALVQSELDSFHQGLADVVHAIDRDAPLVFEPVALRDVSDSAIVSPTPWSHGPGAYAPHIYTDWFSLGADDWVSQDAGVLAPSMMAANAEAQAWGTPLFITEFGCDQSVVQGAPWLSAELDLQEKFLASSVAWVWEETGTWGLNSPTSGESERTAVIVSRSFPRAVAGDIVSITHPRTGDLVVSYTETTETQGLPHEVSMSAVYATGYRVTCDGASVPLTQAVGRATFVCPSSGEGVMHTFEVVGSPQPDDAGLPSPSDAGAD